MDQTGGTWGGANVERKLRQNGTCLRPVVDGAAYKPKRGKREKIKK